MFLHCLPRSCLDCLLSLFSRCNFKTTDSYQFSTKLDHTRPAQYDIHIKILFCCYVRFTDSKAPLKNFTKIGLPGSSQSHQQMNLLKNLLRWQNTKRNLKLSIILARKKSWLQFRRCGATLKASGDDLNNLQKLTRN